MLEEEEAAGDVVRRCLIAEASASVAPVPRMGTPFRLVSLASMPPVLREPGNSDERNERDDDDDEEDDDDEDEDVVGGRTAEKPNEPTTVLEGSA